MRCISSASDRRRTGSETARFPCTHFGSIGFNHGLLLGQRHMIKRQPPPCLTVRLCVRIPWRTSWLMCHEALDFIGNSVYSVYAKL
jgi:hypothetical protein